MSRLCRYSELLQSSPPFVAYFPHTSHVFYIIAVTESIIGYVLDEKDSVIIVNVINTRKNTVLYL